MSLDRAPQYPLRHQSTGGVVQDRAAQPTEEPPGLKAAFEADRQAVIVIHGIGNQRPMDTLRPFVDAVLGVDPTKEQDPLYYSKPDDTSATFELRRLQSRDSRPRTDYFELYWQHLVPTATWDRIIAWLALLLNRRKDDVPVALRGLWAFTRVLALVTALLLVLTIVVWLFPGLVPGMDTQPSDAALPLGLAAVALLIQGVVLNYVGDAATYLSPDPQNIAARQAVREAGVELLERLHEGLDDERKYDRIVIVGHSLGSVIGYDILTYAWPRFNDWHGRPDRPARDKVLAAEGAARDLWAARASTPQELESARNLWLGASRELWIEQRTNEFPWLVTDFITLGSPLAHGLLLLARSRAEFERKKAQNELPVSPPLPDHKGEFSYHVNYKREDGTPRTTIALHHAAVFAVTRWTNLYFPARFGLKGDLIGGPIDGELGPGVVDIDVTTMTRRGWLAHTSYWRPHADDRKHAKSAIVRLIAALDLDRKRFMEPRTQNPTTEPRRTEPSPPA
jgi:hypothetical protein